MSNWRNETYLEWCKSVNKLIEEHDKYTSFAEGVRAWIKAHPDLITPEDIAKHYGVKINE